MAKKDYSLLLVAGAAGVAYLILKKPAQPQAAPALVPQAGLPSNLLQQGGQFLKSLFSASGGTTAPVSTVTPDTTAGQAITSDQVSAAVPGITPDLMASPTIQSMNLTDLASLSGFHEIDGTALAVISGACAACLPGGGSAIGATGKQFNWASLIVPGIILAGGYVLLKNIGLLGGSSSVVASQIDAQTTQANKTALNQVVASGSSPTMNQAQYNSLAVDIYNQGLSITGTASTRAQDQIVYDLMQCRSTADIYSLKVAFGTKPAGSSWYSACSMLNINCQTFDLDAFIKATLDQAHKDQVNQYFQANSINYSF